MIAWGTGRAPSKSQPPAAKSLRMAHQLDTMADAPTCIGYMCVETSSTTPVRIRGAVCARCAAFAKDEDACVYCAASRAQLRRLTVPWMTLPCPQPQPAIVCYDCWDLHCAECASCTILDCEFVCSSETGSTVVSQSSSDGGQGGAAPDEA